MSDLYVAQTIFKQISNSDPSALMAWGMQNPLGSNKETDLYESYDDSNPGKLVEKNFGVRGWVRFDVNGVKVQGRVYVGLNALDYYDVYAMQQYTTEDGLSVFKVVGHKTDIFYDELMTTIDHLIERD